MSRLDHQTLLVELNAGEKLDYKLVLVQKGKQI